MENILDRSETYIRIFTENFRVDKTLPNDLNKIKESI